MEQPNAPSYGAMQPPDCRSATYLCSHRDSPRSKPIPSPPCQPRSSLFGAFGSPVGNARHDAFHDTNPLSVGQMADPRVIATAGDMQADAAGKWSRRPSVRLSKLGRAILGNRARNGLVHSKQNTFEELDGTKSSHSGTWLQKIPFRRSKQRRAATLDASSIDLPEHVSYTADAPVFYEDDYTWDAPRSGGAAARAAAAAQNELIESRRPHTLSREWNRLQDVKLSSDSESGIGIELRDQSEEPSRMTTSIVRLDPATMLPEELFAQILSCLDAPSLMNAEMVSSRWGYTAGSCHLWRNKFTRDYGRASSPAPRVLPGQVGGLGFGSHKPDQDWKRMWKTRQALEARWSHGRAAAIYLEGHQDTVYCVQFDEHKILTGSRDRTIRVWDARTFECLRILGVPKKTSTAQTSGLLLRRPSRGHQPFDIVTPMTSLRPARRSTADDPAEFHHGSVLCLQFDSSLMVTGSSDTTLIIWDVKADWKPIHRLQQHKAGVLDVCFNAQLIVSCSKDTDICLWDRPTGALLRVLSGHKGPVNAVQLRGELIVSASGDGVAKLWNTSGLCVKEFPSRDRGLACVEFSPECRMIFAGGNDRTIYQFDASTGEMLRELKGHTHLVRSLHLDYLNGRIVSGSYDRSIKVYDIERGEMICDFAGWTTSWMLSAKADYRRIVATSQDKKVVIIDFGHGLPDIDLLHGSASEGW